MMNNKIIFICPYYTQKRTAASTYIDNLIARIPKELKYILYCRQSKPTVKNAKCIENLPVYGLIGYRLYAMILAVYYSTIRRNIVITDANPIISLPFSAKTFHIIHHINDIPVLGNISNGNSYSDNLQVANKFDIVSACWRILLFFSPKNIITVSNSEKIKIKRLYSAKSIDVIRNINQFESFQFNKLKEADKYNYDIMMIGHNVKRKNYDFALKVIESAGLLLNKKIRLCIIGNETKKVIKREKYEHISISCYSGLEKNQMIRHIAMSKFYLNTSYLEGYCIPYIECQSLGLIPIVPNQSIFHENCFAKEVYFCEHTSSSFTKSICKAYLANQEKAKPSLENIDMNRRNKFLNKNITYTIDEFMKKVVSNN